MGGMFQSTGMFQNEYKPSAPPMMEFVDRVHGLSLDQKLAQRPSWKELQGRGILLDDPTTKKSHSLQAAQRQLHKRKASQTLDNLLINRPSPNDLHSANIIASDTASLFFGASPTTQVITPNHDEHETNISLDILY